ncbi:MAG: nuclear transport factor 2 family protein [Flavobacteriales bacterium]|nr:nuclear transport factor 2 family protein [Flavobacteriales bacterium]
MRTRTLLPILTVLLLFGLLSCAGGECECADCYAKVDVEAVKAQIEALGAEMDRSIVEQDIEAFMAYYGEGIESYPPGKPAMIGREVIRQNLDEAWAEPAPPGMTFDMQRSDIWVLGDYAVETGTYTFSMEGMDEPEEGKWMNFYENQDGTYRVIRDIWNYDQMPEMPEMPEEEEEATE